MYMHESNDTAVRGWSRYAGRHRADQPAVVDTPDGFAVQRADGRDNIVPESQQWDRDE